MVRKTIKMLAVALIAAFALSSTAEAAPKKTVRHRTKHSSRVASGASATAVKPPAARKPAAKKRTTAASQARMRSQANHTRSTAEQPAVKKGPAPRRPTTKPR